MPRRSSTRYYLLSDHLGGTNVTVTTLGAEYGEVRYKAFGDQRYAAGTTPTTYRFTGQRQDSYINLYWYGSRWYDDSLGRFIQPDTDVPESQGVQGLDRYAYVNNSSVNYTDPSGHMMSECGQDNEECGASQAQIAYETQRYYYENCSSGYGSGCPDYNGAVAFTALGLMTAGAIGPAIDAIGSAAAETITTITTAACADSDCLNEIKTAKDTIQKGITVLGRWPKYVDVAKDVGGKIFNVPTEVWNKLSDAEQWSLNQKFLDDAIARGDYFYLASRWEEAQTETFFLKELEYLFSLGYTLSPYQNYLIPPSIP